MAFRFNGNPYNSTGDDNSSISPPKNKGLLGLWDDPAFQQPLPEITPQKNTTIIDLFSNLDDKIIINNDDKTSFTTRSRERLNILEMKNFLY